MGENKQKAEISIAGGKGGGRACKYPLNESGEDCCERTSVFVSNQVAKA